MQAFHPTVTTSTAKYHSRRWGLPLAIVATLGIVACVTVSDAVWGQNAKLTKAKTKAVDSRILIEECRITPVQVAVLSTDRPGVFAEVSVTEGALVEADAVIARLQDEVAQARYVVAREKATDDVDVRYAAKAAEYARKEYEIHVEANKKAQAFSPLEIEKLKLAMERGILQIQKAEHDFLLNKLTRDESFAELNSYQVKAPFNGTITRIYKHKGEAVRQGDPVLELMNTDHLRIEGYLGIRDRLRVKPGTPVTVKLDIPDEDLEIENEVFEGRVTFIDLAVNPVTSSFRVWAEVPNRDDLLRVGLTAQMIIHPEPEVTATK
ncbi:MAG: HlyD family efflux transporter periplasmic adaptor subunit [Planctomycetaceae bacterium]